MADTTLSFNVLARDNASSTVTKIGQNFGALHLGVGKVTKGLAVLGPALAGLAIGSGLKDFVNEARDSAKIGRLTEQVIKSTGGAAKITANQVGDLATAISNKTGADDEAIQSGENLLLTFTNIKNGVGKGNKIFDAATSAVVDMTAALNDGKVSQDGVKTSSIQLGKALNDPIKGVTALSKVGVSFTDQQKKQIKSLVDSGKTMEAQKIILGELGKEFGGAAEAAADPVTKLSTVVGNAKEAIGTALLPVVNSAATWLGKNLPGAIDTATTFFSTKLLPVIESVGTWFEQKVFPVVGQAVDEFKGLGRKLADAIGPVDVSGIGKDILDSATGWAKSLIGGFKIGVEKGDWKPLGTAIGDGLTAAVDTLGKSTGKILDAIGKLIDKVDWGKLGTKISNGFLGLVHSIDWNKIGDSVGDALITGLQKAKDVSIKLGNAIKSFIDAVDWQKVGHDSTDAIGRFIGGIDWPKLGLTLGKYIVAGLKIDYSVGRSVINAITDVLTGAYNALGEWGKSKALEWGPKLWDGLKSGIVAGAKGIGNWVKGTFIDPFVRWVKQSLGIKSPSTVFAGIGALVVAGFKAGITSGVRGIGTWIYRTVIVPAVTPFANAGRWLQQHGRNLVAGLKTGVTGLAGTIGRWMYDHVAVPAVTPFGKAGSWLVQAGKNVIAGFKNGMVSIWGDVTRWVGGIATWIRDHKGPVSLDGQLLIPAGKAIMSGFLKGLQSGAGPAWDFVQSVGGKTVDMLRAVDAAISTPLASGMSKLVQGIAANYGWGSGAEWNALAALITGESGFRPNAQNPTSSAYGLFQFLDSTWGTVGGAKTSDPTQQTILGLRYIQKNYGDPINAYSKWQSRSPHWYKQGTPWVPNDQLAYLHKGEAVIPADVNAAARSGRTGGGEQRIVWEVHSGGTAMDDLLAHLIRKYVRVNGAGNVQQAFGRT